jgi:methanogenic corrinoid protein MtbC1
MSKIMQTIYQAILEGDQPTVEEAVKSALQANASPAQLLDEAMLPAMNEVGRSRWQRNWLALRRQHERATLTHHGDRQLSLSILVGIGQPAVGQIWYE